MSKYDPLRRRLEDVSEKTIDIELSIAAIEDVRPATGGLSPSLHRLDGFSWSNGVNHPSPQAKAWAAAGFKVERLTATGVVFKRT